MIDFGTKSSGFKISTGESTHALMPSQTSQGKYTSIGIQISLDKQQTCGKINKETTEIYLTSQRERGLLFKKELKSGAQTSYSVDFDKRYFSPPVTLLINFV